MDNNVWNSISGAYSAELKTTTDDIHFGVGIPGNSALRIIAGTSATVAVELGCGSGENLVALSQLGYQPVGVDSSESQLALARRLLEQHGIGCSLILSDVCSKSNHELPSDAGLVLSVGVAHFCPSLFDFLSNCAGLLRLNGDLVLSIPHPLDMVARVVEFDGRRHISMEDYFPRECRISNAHYWQQFAGHIALATGLEEYLCRPSDIVNALLTLGFEVRGIWEPQYIGGESVPCTFKNPDSWFTENFYPCVPQYLIIKATLRRWETG